MAANRATLVAPYALTRLSKTTLADLVWYLAATNGECQSCDDPIEVLRVILDAAKGPQVEAPTNDVRTILLADEAKRQGIPS